MLIKSALLTQMSGSIGGMTGSHNSSGLYLRARTIPVNPASARQVQVRASLATLSGRWSNVLNATQRALWNVYASNVVHTNPVGNPVFLSGINWYIATNTLRLQLPFTIADGAPSIYTRATLTPPGVTSITASTGIAIVTFTNSDLWASAVSGGLMMWGSKPVAPGIEYYSGPYRYVGKIQGAAVAPTSPQNMPAWPFPLVAGQKVFFYFRAINPSADNRYSSDLRGSIVTI